MFVSGLIGTRYFTVEKVDHQQELANGRRLYYKAFKFSASSRNFPHGRERFVEIW